MLLMEKSTILTGQRSIALCKRLPDIYIYSYI